MKTPPVNDSRMPLWFGTRPRSVAAPRAGQRAGGDG
jgi:hypothetical protein